MSQFANHLADGRPAFLIADALVEHLPDQTAQAMGDGADRLGMAEARDQPTVHDVEDRPLGLHSGIWRLG